MNLKSILALAVCTAAINTVNSVYAQKTVAGFEAPESMIKSGNKLLVSNIGGKQPNSMALDSNGFISELSLDGSIIQRKFQKTSLNGPKGLAVIGSTAYTADINRVVGFNTNSGEQVFELNIPDAATLNDKDLAESESVSGKIYFIDVAKNTYDFIDRIPGANGVTYDKNTKQLFAWGMGEQMNDTGKLYVKKINSKDTVFTELPDSPTGIFDGLEMIDKNHLLVTDRISFNSDKGRFVIYDLKDHTTKTYTVEAVPADIHYDKASHIFYLPQTVKNSLLIEDLNILKA